MALYFAHADLKKDKEVILAAVRQTGPALQSAHEDLKKDREIVLAAIQAYGSLGIIHYANIELQNDYIFLAR